MRQCNISCPILLVTPMSELLEEAGVRLPVRAYALIIDIDGGVAAHVCGMCQYIDVHMW
jgi:hypothetical protein